MPKVCLFCVPLCICGARCFDAGPQINNVVATVSLGCLIDLKTIAVRVRNAGGCCDTCGCCGLRVCLVCGSRLSTEYNPKKFAAAILRIRAPRSTALLFTTGRLVVTGEANGSAGAPHCVPDCARHAHRSRGAVGGQKIYANHSAVGLCRASTRLRHL